MTAEGEHIASKKRLSGLLYGGIALCTVTAGVLLFHIVAVILQHTPLQNMFSNKPDATYSPCSRPVKVENTGAHKNLFPYLLVNSID